MSRLEEWARTKCEGADPAHDFQHVLRVVECARRIAAGEGADVEIATTAALLHELFNYPKDHPESARSGEVCAVEAERVLAQEGWHEQRRRHVADCIRTHSFSRGLPPETIEAAVLQDADRLDAIGAIGIARCFATSAAMRRPFYAPEDPFCRARPPDDKQWGLDHFYKKLLKIPATLNTATARRLAGERVAFMERFLVQLASEIGASVPDPKTR
jgi:uncharacterized protein